MRKQPSWDTAALAAKPHINGEPIHFPTELERCVAYTEAYFASLTPQQSALLFCDGPNA